MGKFKLIDSLEPAGDFKIAQSKDIAYNGVSVEKALNDQISTAEQVETNTAAIAQNTADINTQSGKIETLSGKVTAAETAIAGKASQSEVDSIKTDVAGKASQTEVETIKTDVAGKASAEAVTQLQTDMSVQTARMDQLVGTVPEGSADEIADARVTADGKTEANLGNAIRTQISGLKETIADQNEAFINITEKSTKNLFDAEFIAHSNLSASGEYLYDPDGYPNTAAIETYIEIAPYNSYTVSCVDGLPSDVLWFIYDADKNYVRNIKAYKITTNSNEKFVRFKIAKTDGTDELAALKGWQLEKGNTPTSYESPKMPKGYAELIDIRKKIDGSTSPSAGDAVRAQISDLRTEYKQNLERNTYSDEDLFSKSIYGNIVQLDVNVVEGGVKETDGIIEITSSTVYHHTVIDCSNRSRVYVIYAKSSTSNSYPYYAYAVSHNGKVLKRYCPKSSIDTFINTKIIVPMETDKLYVMTSGNIIVENIVNVDTDNYMKSVNALNLLRLNKYGYYDPSRNLWSESVTNKQTDYIECVSGETLYLNSLTSKYISFFDKNFVYLTRVLYEQSSVASEPSSFQVPNDPGIAYLSFPVSVNEANFDSLMLTRIPMPQTYIPYNKKIIKTDINSKNVMLFGDSITAKDIRWVSTFLANIMPDKHKNYAVSGATWRDTRYNTTFPYTGDSSTNNNNVMGNQVQKAINEHEFEPDYIFIACGTNDNWRYEDEYEIESQFSVENEIVPIENVMRYTFAGAMRWCVEALRNAFPHAEIIIITPIQCAIDIKTHQLQHDKNTRIKDIAARLGCTVFDAYAESGIYSNLEHRDQVGKYLIDGLHPNPTTGGKQYGNYLSNRFKSFIVSNCDR